MKIVSEAGFCKVHVFKYSKRKGTVAAEMADQVPGDVKNHRSRVLMEKAAEAGRKFFDECAGQTRRVLFEETDGDGLITGFTDNYVKVWAAGGEEMLKQFYNVRLVNAFKDGMKGEIENV